MSISNDNYLSSLKTYILLLFISIACSDDSNPSTKRINTTPNQYSIHESGGSMSSEMDKIYIEDQKPSMFNDLSKKYTELSYIVLVTGAGNGLGKEFVKILLAKGWKVIGIDKDRESLIKLKKELNDQAASFMPLNMDVSDYNMVKQLSRKMKETNRKPCLFILNAAVGFYEKDGEIDIRKEKYLFDTNYFGVMGWVSEWIGHVSRHGGTFVGLSSLMAYSPYPYFPSYSASKAAVKSAFTSLRIQYSNNEKIKFVTVMPGPINTKTRFDKKVPFVQKADESAKYILKKVFEGKKTIEFPFFYSVVTRSSSIIPDKVNNKSSTEFIPEIEKLEGD